MTAVPSPGYGAPATETERRVRSGPTGLGALTLGFFACPAFPLAALALALVVYLPNFYAGHLGISLTTVGAVFSVIRLLDLGVDPFLGGMMDRTRTRVGRYRPWMLASIPILMVGCWLAFMPYHGAGPLYLIGALVLVYFGYSIGVLGHMAWGGVLVDDYHERSRVFGWVQASTVGGMILVLILPIILAKTAPGNEAAGVASMGWFIILMTPLTILLAVWRAPEPLVGGGKAPAASPMQYLAVLRRPSVIRILACTTLLASAPGINGAVFLFFFRQSRGFSPADSSLLLLIYFVGGFAGAPVWSWASKALGKHKAMMVGCAYYAVFQALALAIPKGSLAVGVPIMLLSGVGFSAYLILLRAMTADVCDEARLDLKADFTGVIYALHNAGAKIGSAIGVAITFPMLEQVFHFKPGMRAHNTPFAIHGLEFAFVALPILCVIAAGLSLIGYRLTEERHKEIRAALVARGEG